MDFSSLGPHVYDARLFKGSARKPFLAPRGVHIAKEKLFVSDTGQNRVFIWHKIPQTEYEEPDVILGQIEVEASERNQGGAVSAATLLYPSGIWSDGTILIICDAWNHRVLIWHELPTQNGQAADVVIGQPDFMGNQPNVEGQSANPDANTLNWPYGVWSDGTHIWIADTGNRRILYFDAIPTKNFTNATKVVGKPDLQTRDYENHEPIWPYSVKINVEGQMIVADTQFYRNLIWYDWKTAFYHKADVIIGQPDFDACGQNQYGLSPNQRSLNWTYDACFYKNGILVNDTGNSRILWHSQVPKTNNQAAKAIIGRPDFNTSSEYKGNLLGTESAIYWPFSISTYKDQLVIADTGNHRLVLSKLNL
ncbi:hypothetical protein ABN763_15240 [Spongiivirga sp. MCCC 1A20706]|uniref:hypothetical protein n=1 Tax=Spongiivirga sp. MCCC 1A20706 TaxID=3160963 RepID=UPI003977C90F